MSGSIIAELREKKVEMLVQSPHEIYEEDVHKCFSILYTDGKIINRTAEEIAKDIKTLKMTKEQTEIRDQMIQEQLSVLYSKLTEWCRKHTDNINTAVIVAGQKPGTFWFVVMKKDNHYDLKFASELSQLEIDIETADKSGLIALRVFDVPKIENEQFNLTVSHLVSVDIA